MNKPLLPVEALCAEAARFAELESVYPEPALYGVTDGKAVGTYFEHKFQAYLHNAYDHAPGNAAKGIDFPALNVDIKVTSVKQPQSSCPFRSARQKVFGLGYSLLVFVYQKIDDPATRTSTLNVLHAIFVESNRTADFQTTFGIRKIIENEGNEDDLVAFLQERYLPVDEITVHEIAAEVLKSPPELGFLTVSNALQWRLQYGRVIDKAGEVEGIHRIR